MDFAACVLSVWGRLPSYDPKLLPPPPSAHCIRVYSILIHTGKGGGGELTREMVWEAIVQKAGRKLQHDWLYLQSINFI